MDRPPDTRWIAVLAAMGAGVVAAFHVGKLPSSLPAMRAEIGLSMIAAGWVASAFNTVGTFGSLPLGVLSTRVGRLRIVVAGLLLLIAGGAIGAFAATPATLLFARAMEGAGLLGVAVAVPALIVAASAPSDRGLVLGLWSTYMPIGAVIMLVATPLALPTIGWRGLWIVTALLTAALLVLLLRQHESYRAAEQRHGVSLAAAASTLRRPGLWAFGAAFATYTAQWVTLLIWMPTHLTDGLLLAPAESAFYTALFVTANIPGNVIGTWWLRRGARFGTVIAVSSALMGACVVPIFADGSPVPLRLACYYLLSACGGMLPAAALSGAPRFARQPDHVALTSGVVMQGSMIGQFIGPPLAATLVATRQEWSSVIPLLLASAALGIAIGVGLNRSSTLRERH